jgi:hypothetical protein
MPTSLPASPSSPLNPAPIRKTAGWRGRVPLPAKQPRHFPWLKDMFDELGVVDTGSAVVPAQTVSAPASPRPCKPSKFAIAKPLSSAPSFEFKPRVDNKADTAATMSFTDVLAMASSKSGISLDVAVSYTDLIRPETFQALTTNPVLTAAALKRKHFFLTDIVLQLNKDIRDFGKCIPYATKANLSLPMAAKSFVDAASGLTMAVVHAADKVLHKECAAILVNRLLVDGTVEAATEDMLVYTSEPFYTIACFRGDKVVGVAVFNAHELNTKERLIQLQLFASKLNEPPGVGTAMMKVLRGLSQVSPLHQGFIAAQAVKTPNAKRFYARKLPDCNSPLARALLLSVTCLDPSAYLASHLDLRATVVFPNGV